MDVNALPFYDASDNPTGCCARFNAAGWDDQELRLEAKPFVRATTRCVFHVPLDMAAVFKRTLGAIEAERARKEGELLALSRDLSPWAAEHYFAVDRDVPGVEMVRLSGRYWTKVFEGPFKDAPKWKAAFEAEVARHGETAETIYFFYTTCPKCAKAYGQNSVVGVAKVAA